jgi:hypothetical protein
MAGCGKRTRASEAEESPLLEAVTKERLVKTELAEKGSAGVLAICKTWRLDIALFKHLQFRVACLSGQ